MTGIVHSTCWTRELVSLKRIIFCRPQKPLVRHPGDPMAMEKARQCEVHMQPPKRPNCCKTWLSKFPTRYIQFIYSLRLASMSIAFCSLGHCPVDYRLYCTLIGFAYCIHVTYQPPPPSILCCAPIPGNVPDRRGSTLSPGSRSR